MALICGGGGPDVWDRDITIGGDNMTISQALAKIEEQLEYSEVVVSIEQV